MGLKVLCGVEISTVAQCGDVHVLAFNMDTQHPAFAEEMKVISDFRRKRNEEMQKKFIQHGIDVDIFSRQKGRLHRQRGHCAGNGEKGHMRLHHGSVLKSISAQANAATCRQGGLLPPRQ